MDGIVFNIQRFSTHDGPGVRTVVFLKGCPLRCFWCQNPESQTVKPVLMYREESCVGCGACMSACPEGAARLAGGVSVIDREKCTGCGKCVQSCRGGALTLSGRSVSVDEVMSEIMKDRAYYLNSGGGVTLSGGEATAQSEFSLELLRRCREKYLNTAVETCGFAPADILRSFAPLTDLFLYDIKTVFGDKHLRGTGHGNALILENAKMLAGMGCAMKLRMPLIPGYNDSPEDVLALRKFVETELRLGPESIELLKYNQLGEVKFKRLGRSGRPGLRPQSDDYFDELRRLLD